MMIGAMIFLFGGMFYILDYLSIIPEEGDEFATIFALLVGIFMLVMVYFRKHITI